MQKYTIYRKPMGENLFEEEFTIDALSQMGNPLLLLTTISLWAEPMNHAMLPVRKPLKQTFLPQASVP